MMDLRRKGLLLLGLLAISTVGLGGEDVKKSELEAERAKAAAARIKAMETARTCPTFRRLKNWATESFSTSIGSSASICLPCDCCAAQVINRGAPVPNNIPTR